MPCLSSTDLHTTNIVDVNWTVTVIDKLRLPPKLLMTPLFLRQRTVMDADHCGRRAQIFGVKEWSKMQFLPTPSAFGASFGVIDSIPSKYFVEIFRIIILRVPGLSCGVVFEILRLAVLIQHRLVTDKPTDGRTDKHAMTAKVKLYISSCIAAYIVRRSREQSVFSERVT